MKKSSFVEGTILATLSIIIVKILGMLYVIPFYAMVGIQGSALYAYAYNIYVIFLDISTAGLPIAISKVISEYDTLKQMEAKQRTYKIGQTIIGFISIIVFIIILLFAPQIAKVLLGDLSGGNTVEDVTLVLRSISLALLVVPFLSVSKGYLQGHKIFNVSSISQILEQVIRISVILGGTYICLYILKLDMTKTISISITGAFFGALVAYLYIAKKIRDNKKSLGIVKVEEKDNITNKEIIKKIISYAIPFIIINTVFSIYNFADMVLILRTMDFLNFSAIDVEFIASSITTWSGKICMIVTSIAMGLTMSLIPTIVSAFTLKDFKEVNNKLNQALQIMLMVSLPMTVGLSLLSKPVWNIFYGLNSSYGPSILSIVVFASLFGNIYMVTSSTLQSLNKFKLVYKSALLGFLINISLDVPIMLLYHKIGIGAHLGASTASIIGYSFSSIYILYHLRKEHNLRYGKVFNLLKRLVIPIILMSLGVILTKYLIPINYDSKLSSIIYVGINSLVGGLIYLGYLFKKGILKEVFGETLFNNIMKKLTLGKFKTN